jgi:glucosamine kinase
MILIADSGATKIEWRLIKEDGSIKQAISEGYNPYVQEDDDLRKGVVEHVLEVVGDSKVKELAFYGAGCGSEEKNRKVAEVLAPFFPDATIEVNNDLLAAARALCGSEPGIACILGTGSNSCYYDGEKIAAQVPSLGYVLGDEGSGANMGRKLLIAAVRNSLPSALQEAFDQRFGLTEEDVLENVYKKKHPSRFLASFMKFLMHHINEPYVYKLIYDSFTEFFTEIISSYKGYENLPVHFTGSVAFYYGNILRQVASDQGVTVKNIIEGPIAGLTLYHQEKTFGTSKV